MNRRSELEFDHEIFYSESCAVFLRRAVLSLWLKSEQPQSSTCVCAGAGSRAGHSVSQPRNFLVSPARDWTEVGYRTFGPDLFPAESPRCRSSATACLRLCPFAGTTSDHEGGQATAAVTEFQ